MTKMYFLLILAIVSTLFRTCIGNPLLFADLTEMMWQNLQSKLPSSSSTSTSSNSKNCILPDATKPISYVLNVMSISDETSNGATTSREFSGSVIIETVSINGTQKILLHCRNLRISSVKLLNARTQKELFIVYSLKPEDEILYIGILDVVSSSESFSCKLIIEFSGKLNNNQMIGFYRTWYKVGSQTRWLAVTQFQPTFARMAFPCFDEPRFKTPFTISITRRTDQTSLSNMPLSHQTIDHSSDTVTDTFLTSPSMPTYLVAFAVLDFRSVDAGGTTPNTPNETSVRAWARDGVIENTAHLLSAVPRILRLMEVYTTIPYALPKMDLLAVPNMDFPAMEHWGLLTFSEKYSLYNEKINVHKELIQVISVVAHEIAHQWFGNYVTADSWSYIWLNEGFARFFESKLTAEVEPSWRMNDYFVVEFVHRVLFEDGVNFHHPMTDQVRTSNDIANVFNMITYDKGGSILRMLEHMVSSQVFRKTLQNYLKNSYAKGGTVNPSDLWREFEAQLQLNNAIWIGSNNFTNIMEQWTTQTGYPLVIVSKRQDDILIQQEIYDASRRSTWLTSSMWRTTDSVWGIPISYTTKNSINFNDTRPTLILASKQATLPVRLRSKDWILVNVQQTGYYRVHYDSHNWKLLTKQLLQDHSLIHPLNRAQLIDDSFSLAIDMKLSYTIPLSLSTYLRAETDVIPWIPALKKIDFLFDQYQGTRIEDLLQFSRVGLVGRETDDQMLRTMRSWIAPYACKAKVELCKRAAEREYSKHIADLSQISDDIKQIVFCVALGNGDQADDVWNDLWHLYRKSSSAREKAIILRAIGCTPNVHHLRAYVEMLVNQDIRQEYHKHVIRALSSSANGVTAMLSSVCDTMKNITSRKPNELRVLTLLVKVVGERSTTEEHSNFFRQVISDAERIPDRRRYAGIGSLINAVLYANRISKQRMERNRLVQEDMENALREIQQNSRYDSTTMLRYVGCLIALITWICYL